MAQKTFYYCDKCDKQFEAKEVYVQTGETQVRQDNVALKSHRINQMHAKIPSGIYHFECLKKEVDRLSEIHLAHNDWDNMRGY